MAKPVFLTNFFEQKRSLETLLKESRADSSFYLFLSLSTFITTVGFLLNSGVIIVGGMLVAPLLFPILSLGMGITTSSSEAIRRSLKNIAKSVAIVFIISFLTAFILNRREVTAQMEIASSVDLLFFLTAFASGVIASYAWVKERVSSAMPGVAVAVSLLPPLALSGVALSLFSRDLLAGSLALFLINLLGIVVASTIVFSLFGFSSFQRLEEEKIKEEALERKVQEAARREAGEANGNHK